MRKLATMLLTAILGICMSGCALGASDTVSTDGSTSMEKVIGVLSEAFMQQDGGSVTYNPTGSGAGIQAVYEGRTDIGLSSRNLTPEETEKGLVSTILAYDGIAVIVGETNPVDDLSIAEIAEIYTGSITNWSEVGGEDAPIVVIGREAGSGTRDGFESVTDTEDRCKYRQELTSTGDVITTVSQNPDAVGYASIASVGDNVKVLAVGGVLPNEETILDGSYTLQRPFLFITDSNRELSEASKNFVAFCMTPESADLIRKAGVVPAGQ